jgi:hypothetical protein
MTECIQLLKNYFQLDEEGNLCNYLGIKITKRNDGLITLTQLQLIDSIIHDPGLQSTNEIVCSTPAPSSILLHRDQNGLPFYKPFYYCSVIGKLNFLDVSIHI